MRSADAPVPWRHLGHAGPPPGARFMVNIPDRRAGLARLLPPPLRSLWRPLHETSARPRRTRCSRAGAPRRRANQVGHAHRVSGEQLPHREHPAVRQRRRQGHRRQAQDHRARQRVAVQGAGDQARRPGRPGAGRRNPARQLRERGSSLWPRRHPVSRHVLRRLVEAVQGIEEDTRGQARQTGHEAAVRGPLAAAGHLHQAHACRAWPT